MALGDRVEITAALLDGGNLEQLCSDALALDPDVLALSLPIGGVDRGLRLLDRLGAAGPLRAQVVVGNLVATNAPEPLLRELPPGSWLVRGEGERAFVGILSHLLSGESGMPLGLPGFAALDGSGRLQASPLDDGPPFGGYDRLLWQPTIGSGGSALVEASRGCHSSCSFCSSRALHPRGWRPRPLDAVVAEVEELHQAGVRWVFFVDDDFVGEDWARAVELGRAIHDALPDLTFGSSFQARSFRTESDRARLSALVGSGLRSMLIGMESGCSSQLRRFGKASSREMVVRAVELVREHPAVELSLGFLLDPLMTVEELVESATFVLGHDLAPYVSNPFNTLDVHHGTRFAQRAAAEGLLGDLTLNDISYACRYRDPRMADVMERVAEVERLTGLTEAELRAAFRRRTRRAFGRTAPVDVADLGDLLADVRRLKMLHLAAMADDRRRTSPGTGLDAARRWCAEAASFLSTTEVAHASCDA